MFTHWLRYLRQAFATNRQPTQRRQARRLGVEALEDRTLPATVYGLLPGNVLIRFDSATPGNVTTIGAVSGLGTNETLQGIDFRPRTGQLIGTTATTGSTTGSVLFTYSINPLNGAATFIGQTVAGMPAGAGDVETGYDFNPTVDRIRYVNTNDENARLNPNNGTQAGDDTDLTAAADVIAAAYDRNYDRQTIMTPANNAVPTTLYVINRATSSLALQGGPNGTPSPNGGVVADLGPLGFPLSATNDGGFDIAYDPSAAATLNNGGLGRALAALTANDNVTRLYDINLTLGAATSIGLIGNGMSELISIAIAPTSSVAVGSGLGANGDARLLDATTGAVRQAVVPFAGFQGGVRVASGDINADGFADLVVSADAPQGHVKVFDGVTGAQLYSFFAFVNFQGTVNIATGDVNADGFDDILVVANGVSGHVKAFSGRDGSELASFLAYPGFTGITTIASADFNNDGLAEIITAASINGHVKIFNANGTAFTGVAALSNSFLAFDGFFGTVFVSGGDVNGDGRPDIIVGAGSAGHVKAFSGVNGSQISSFIAPGVNRLGGVGVSDVNRDGRYEIVVTPALGTQATVFAFDPAGTQITSYAAFANYLGGASVGGIRI